MFVDIHSHIENTHGGTLTVQNIIIGEEPIQEPLNQQHCYSAGIHPWYISKTNWEQQLIQLENMLNQPQVKLVGECGLDRLNGPDLQLQQQVFERQIQLAEKFKKPLIIHCVKCFSELLQIKKKTQPTVPLIIHGFNNKVEIASQLLNVGFNFSLGAALLNANSNAAQLIKHLPDNRIFLETDDKKVSISEIYQAAASLKNISLNQLKDIIFAHWMSL
jgi:TatD DNase family protein